MKIRTGFVSNSSSTSFLIIAKSELNKADFFELMGIDLKSPIADLFAQFYEEVISSSEMVDFKNADEQIPPERLLTDRPERLSEHMLRKIKEAKANGLKAYYGWLSSDNSMIETFFCMDSFEVENDKVYLNGLECVW
jgi:hypothetical protein